VSLTDDQIAAIARFPDQNPNPVMRMAPDGRLRYANRASRPILDRLGIGVGDRLPSDVTGRLLRAAAEGTRVELAGGHETYELVVVDVSDLGFLNIYGSDVTARRAIEKFPDENPNPVFRIRADGTLLFANPASEPIVEAFGCVVGRAVPATLLEPILAQVAAGQDGVVEIEAGPAIYALKVVQVPAFGFINAYGTDITAARQLEKLHRENERLLLNILPEPIAARLRSGEALIADRFDDVTLMFADIVEFTRMSSSMSPYELVKVLNDVFTVFDELVERYQLEKVKTIGDAYMVVGGMLDGTTDHVERVAAMAVDLAERVAAIDAAQRLGVRFRIGINCGPVVAGVIGTKKFIYDIWGDTVNMASRMESLGLPGRIQVTGAVAERVRGRFQLEPRGIVEVKGKGPTPTWFLGPSIHEPAARASTSRQASHDAAPS
jgi:class 3 adenylate cyclase